MAYAKDGKTLATACEDHTVKLRDTTTGTVKTVFKGHEDVVSAVAISPDGKLAYVTNYANSTITPIDLATNAARTPIVVGGAPYGIAFAKDGKTAVVVVRRDNACVTVDVATGLASKPILLGNGPYTIAIP